MIDHLGVSFRGNIDIDLHGCASCIDIDRC